MVVTFIQRAGHKARIFLFVVIDARTSSKRHFCHARRSFEEFLLVSSLPIDKKANIKRELCNFLSRFRSKEFFPACRGLQIQGTEQCRGRLMAPFYTHFDSLIPTVLVYKPVTQHHSQKTSKGGLRLKLFFPQLFVRSGKNFPRTCTLLLDASLAAGSSVVVQCAGIDRTNQRSLVFLSISEQANILAKVAKYTMLKNLGRQTLETQADPLYS